MNVEFFKFRNEYYNQIERKKWMKKKCGHLSSFCNVIFLSYGP